MANHKSSVKRIRQTASRRLHNRYYAKTMRNAVRKLRATTDKAAATELLPKVQKMLDKLAKNNIIPAVSIVLELIRPPYKTLICFLVVQNGFKYGFNFMTRKNHLMIDLFADCFGYCFVG